MSLFGLAFAIAGLVLFGFALSEVYAIAEMAAWAKTQGTITDSGGWQLVTSKFFHARLSYEYVAEGHRFTGCEDSWKSSRMRYGWGKNLHHTGSYGWSEKVAVYYDPSHPEKAVLRPGLSYATALTLKTSLLSVLSGMALLVASAQLRATPSPTSRIDGAVRGLVQRFDVDHSIECWAGRTAFALLVTCALWVVMGVQPLSPRRCTCQESMRYLPRQMDSAREDSIFYGSMIPNAPATISHVH